MPRIEWHRNRAQEALARLFPGADPMPLGTWGYDWWQAVQEDRTYPPAGALVTEDGQIVGEVERVGGAFRVTDATRQQYGLDLTVADRAAIQIGRQVGQRVAVIRAEQVAPMRPLWPEELVRIEQTRTQIAGLTARLEHRIVEAVDQREALGVTMRQIADAAGMTEQGVRQMVKRTGQP